VAKHDLPPCSVKGCNRAAGVIMNGAMLCPKHASEALEARRAAQKKG
jgi:hypothetical protein